MKEELARNYALNRLGDVENIIDLEAAFLSGFDVATAQYERLLEKYIQHVFDNEGSTFISRLSAGYSGVKFTQKEIEILKNLDI